MNLTDAKDAFLRSCLLDKNLSELTERAYKTDLKQFESFARSRTVQTVNEVDALLIQEYVSKLRIEGSYSDASVRRKLAVVKAFLKFLERSGALSESPAVKLRISFQQVRRLPPVLTRSQVEAVLESAKRSSAFHGIPGELENLRNHALVELLFYSGARISELLKLDFMDIDLQEGYTKINGKGRRERIIYIGCEPVIIALKRYMRLRKQLKAMDPALFLNNRLKRLSVYSAEAAVRKCATRAGLSMRVTPHMFRHTMATMLLENGADLRSIQEILGHASIRTTEIYTHVSANRKRDVMRRFHPRLQFEVRRARSA